MNSQKYRGLNDMTKQEQDIFFSVIRASIWQKEIDVEIPVGFQWKPVLQAYADHAILAVVADKILELPVEKQPSKEQKKLIMWYVASTIKTHNELDIAVVDIFRLLWKNNLHPVLLKGQGLATFYPNPPMRGCGDIDIYVGQVEYKRACELLDEYCGEEEKAKAHETINHYEISRGDVSYEIHKFAMASAFRSRLKEAIELSEQWLVPEKFDYVKINGVDIPVPPAQYNVFFVFEHMCRHFRNGGVGLRQVIDWLLLMRHADSILFRNDILLSQLGIFSLERIWQIMGGIAVKQLGYPASSYPCYSETKALKSQNEVLNLLVRGGNFGSLNPVKRDYLSLPRGIKRWKRSFASHYEQYRPEIILMPRDGYKHLFEYVLDSVKGNLTRRHKAGK